MGHGIAHVTALMGAHVRLHDAQPGAAASGLAKISKNLAKGVELGKLGGPEREAALARIQAVDDLAEACRSTDCVIEAVPERLELKREVFGAVERAAPSHALLATNTSSLSIASIASSVSSPGRVVGMHFFNPVHVMKLVEVVQHPRVDPAAVALAVALAEAMGKTPITV